MTNQEKLDILNSMKIIDEDCGGGELVYVNVEYNKENIEKISQVVPDVNVYLKNVGDPDGTKEGIDIVIAAFEHANADFYYKGKFVIFTKEQLLEMYEDEKGKRMKAENELKNYISQFNYVKGHIQDTLEALG
ncbi:hypothetical protein [Lysinibacillus sp. Bpr_S20]|uniref:hypothetical protein n=1 Tax=Lysinibacillus sp. Bpr_S20 TaxID=2933964 RepID=UPI0020120744|nr:hypothetical protein [Lysinibacillus sp. Bpr_S20]MCL1700724.1 hypothetical protein [Lysinibacillus sp. Bpr_S20]